MTRSRHITSKGSLLVVEESHELPMVDFEVTLRTGSTFDPVGKEGLSRLTARMVRMGTKKLDAMKVEESIDALGASLGIETAPSYTRFSGAVIKRNFQKFMELLAELLLKPAFRNTDLQQAKRETISDIVDNRDNDRGLAAREFRKVLFAGHPYERSVIGTQKSVSKIGRSDVERHFDAHYRAANLIFGFAGDITLKEGKEVVDKVFARIAKGAAPKATTPDPKPIRGRRVVVVDKPARTQTQIFIGGLGTHPKDADHVALAVANTVFGGTFTSRLMQEVRSKRGWSYGASSRLGTDRAREAFYMWTFPSASDAVACVKLEIELLETLLKTGITKKELKFAQDFLVNSNAFEIDTPIKRLDQRVDVELYGLPKDYFDNHIKRVRAVTLEKANRALRARLSATNLVVVMLATASEVATGLKTIPGVTKVETVSFDRD